MRSRPQKYYNLITSYNISVAPQTSHYNKMKTRNITNNLTREYPNDNSTLDVMIILIYFFL